MTNGLINLNKVLFSISVPLIVGLHLGPGFFVDI